MLNTMFLRDLSDMVTGYCVRDNAHFGKVGGKVWGNEGVAPNIIKSLDTFLIVERAGISANHAAILQGCGQFYLFDLRGEYGTWYQGKDSEEREQVSSDEAWELFVGDRIWLGKNEYRVEVIMPEKAKHYFIIMCYDSDGSKAHEQAGEQLSEMLANSGVPLSRQIKAYNCNLTEKDVKFYLHALEILAGEDSSVYVVYSGSTESGNLVLSEGQHLDALNMYSWLEHMPCHNALILNADGADDYVSPLNVGMKPAKTFLLLCNGESDDLRLVGDLLTSNGSADLCASVDEFIEVYHRVAGLGPDQD